MEGGRKLTYSETIKILSLIKVAYPRFYLNITKSDAEATANLWASMFMGDDFEVIKIATQSLIATFQYPPTIADIKNQVYKLQTSNEKGAIEEWNDIKNAIKNSSYYASEMFEKLPPIAKKFVGSPSQLKEWATTTDFNDGVVRGQFLKQYEVLKEKERYTMLVPDNVKNLLQDVASKLMLKE